MNALAELFALWMADFFLLSTLMLGITLLACRRTGQPARRLAIAWPALAVLLLLAGLCALPGWSLVHLVADAGGEPTRQAWRSDVIALPNQQPTTQLIPTIDVGQRHQASPPPTTRTFEISQTRAPLQKPLPWTVWLVGAYLGGSLLSLVWQASGGVLARRLIAQAQPAPAVCQSLLAGVVGAPKRLPNLLISDRIQAPAALGLFRPAILLPKNMLQSPAESLRPILAHEWAHIRLGDIRTLATARTLMILLWPQPLYWLLRRQIHRDQETLADVAGSDVSSPGDYANQLVAWARVASTARAPRIASSVGLWEKPSQLQRRIAMLLDEKRTVLRYCSRGWRLGSALCLFALAVGLSLVTLSPGDAVVAEETQRLVNGNLTQSTPIAEAENETRREEPAASSLSDEALQKVLRPLYKRLFAERKPNEIHGICVDEMGRPLEGVSVRVYPRLLQGAADRSKSIMESKSDNKGEFHFTKVVDIDKEFPEGLPEEHFRPWPAKTLTVVGRSEGRVPGFGNDFASSIAKRGKIEVWVMKPAATLRGRVVDGQGEPVVGARVSAGIADVLGNPFGMNTATTNEEGEFEIADLAPFDAAEERRGNATGEKAKLEKTAFRFRGNESLLVKHPKFATRRVSVSRIPGTVDIQLKPGGVIVGRVTVPEDSPATDFPSGSHVRLERVLPQPKPTSQADNEALYALWQTETTMLDKEGSYRFESLPAGKYHLSASVEGWTTRGIENVSVDRAETVTAPAIALSRGGRVRVQLVDDPSGKPMRFENPTKGYLNVMPRPRRAAVFGYRNSIVDFSIEGVAEIQLSAGQYVFLPSIPMFEGGSPIGDLMAALPEDMDDWPTYQVEEGAVFEIPIRMKQVSRLLADGTVTFTQIAAPHDSKEDAENEVAKSVLVPATTPTDTDLRESDSER